MQRTVPWLVTLGLVLAACSGGGGDDAGKTGTLRIGVERIDGAFVEGFQLTFMVAEPDGSETTYRWDDLVTGDRLEWPPDVGPQDIERWYAGVLVEEVVAGEIAVTSKLDLGMEPPGQPCTARIDVPAGGAAEVRVGLTGDARGCPVLTDDGA